MSGRIIIAAAPAPLAGLTGTAISIGIIDKCVVFNTGATTVTATLHLVSVSGTPGVSNQVGRVEVPAQTTAFCAAVVGAYLSVGQRLVVIPSVAGILNVYAAIRE